MNTAAHNQDRHAVAIGARPCQATNSLLALAVTSWLTAGCGVRPPVQPHSATPAEPAGATPLQLDAAASQVWLYLHADGPLAGMGHTHVITTRALRGTVWLQPQPEHSSCDIELSVTEFVVDDPQERAAAGGEFADPLDDSARNGTRDHMLGERQLDAQHYPTVFLHCRQLRVASDSASVGLAVTVRGREAVLQVPVKWRREGEALEIEGEFDFRQSDLGLEPYSLLFGALRVADVIHAQFQLLARRQP